MADELQLDESDIRDMYIEYWDNRQSLRAVSRTHGVSHEYLRLKFIKLGLQVRTRKESWSVRNGNKLHGTSEEAEEGREDGHHRKTEEAGQAEGTSH